MARQDTLSKKPTKFAPAERAGADEIKRQARLFTKARVLGVLPDAVPCVLFVVNEHRQIVFANERIADVLSNGVRPSDTLGRRPGEVLGCGHASEADGGCGTTQFCSVCGMVHAVLTSQTGTADVRDCRVVRASDNETLELRVWTTPVEVAGEKFTIVAALDIGHEKRREALEHIFLHDIYNVAYGLRWYADFLKKADPAQVAEFTENIDRLCGELIDDIDAQRILIRAENRELLLRPESLRTHSLLQDAVEMYARHPVAEDRQLCIDEAADDVEMVGDRTLLRRVLCNMIKNGLEACRAGETVTAGCTAQDNRVEFWVHNPGFIPCDVQPHVFQRFYSTKGAGRGLGAYSIKLLTERYLRGQVTFSTSPEEGTIFRARYPVSSKV